MEEVQDVQIRLAALWIALMLTYLLGDVIRVFAPARRAARLDTRRR